jgi:glutamine synthetase
MSPAELRIRFEADDIRRVKVGCFDLDGVLRGKYISLDKFWSAVEGGLGFCDVIYGWDIGDALYDNVELTGWHTGYPDAAARIDPDTLRTIPWEPRTAFFLMDLYTQAGDALPVAPRHLLRRVVERAAEHGYTPACSVEYEFFFFRESPASLREKGYRNLTPLSPGMFGYSVLRASGNSALVLDIIDQLAAFHVPLEGFHTETGPGVYEAAIAVDGPLAAADRAALFKTAVKEIAARHGVIPTFMAKWNPELPGSSGHIHQSLWDVGAARNLFHTRDGLMRRYVGGLVRHMPELMVMLCPTINSYKRTVPGTWAPVNCTWGIDNRTTAVRVIPGTARSCRAEMRLSGSDVNPYLAIAACLAAGIEGIESGLEPPEPAQNAYQARDAQPLPRSLQEANCLFRSSKLARNWFGDEFVEHYAATRDWEVRLFEKAVTDWELARYFESI